MAIRPTFLVRPEFKIQQAIGPHEDLLTIVKGRKLQWYGHAYRSSGLAKTILQGTVKGGRIREWTGLNSPPVFSIFPVLHCPLGLEELQACPFPDVVFPLLLLPALSSSPFHCALQDGVGQT